MTTAKNMIQDKKFCLNAHENVWLAALFGSSFCLNFKHHTILSFSANLFFLFGSKIALVSSSRLRFNDF